MRVLALLRATHAQHQTKVLARWLIGLIVLQVATGISNVVFAWPLAVAVLHNGGAAALALVMMLLIARLAPVSAVAASPAPANGIPA